MKKIIIVAPHFPPSNLAAVHRARLFAKYLPEFGWEPIVVTIHHKYYEEKPDWDLFKTLPPDLRVEKVGALPILPFRMIGDIGVRGFFPMLLRILKIIKKEKIDFLYITIPSFYSALLGRLVNLFTGIKYGVDYIDPWVHSFPGSKKKLSRAWLSTLVARILEPIAIKRASLITGVASGYFEGVFARNPCLKNSCLTLAIPYGAEKSDFEVVEKFSIKPYLFKDHNSVNLVYAGAFLPQSIKPLREIFSAIKSNNKLYSNVRFNLIGTGRNPVKNDDFAIKAIAQEYGLWEKVVFEYPNRMPYLDVLAHLKYADGIFILGSTEPHYSPSKVFQAFLSKKPIFAVLHKKSTAFEMIKNSRAGIVLEFDGEGDIDSIRNRFDYNFSEFIKMMKSFDHSNINQSVLDKYSAHNITQELALTLDKLVKNT
jgi:glycosyltransferase involved in cell wall biosynthesis